MIVRSVGEWVYAPQCFWEMALFKCCVVWTYNRTALRLRAVNMQWNAYGIMFRVVWYMLGFQPVSCGVCICPGVVLCSAPGCFIYRFQRCSPHVVVYTWLSVMCFVSRILYTILYLRHNNQVYTILYPK